MTKSKLRNELTLILLLAAFALGCMLTKSTGTSLGMKNERMTPQTYSDALCWLLLFMLGLRTVLLLRGGWKEQTEEKAKSRSTGLLVGFVMLCSVLFVLGMQYLGFYITTFVSLAVLYLTFENWNKKDVLKGLLFAAGTSGVFYIAFGYLKVFLPNALLF